jgi:protein subunit release factor B
MSIDPPDFTCEIHIRASFGGVEAHYFAAMLLRMYVRWAERDGLRCEVGEVDGDAAGEVAQATLKLAGEGLLQRLRGEAGAHRLVRVPPGETRRHVSFAFVEVSPAGDDDGAPTTATQEQVRTYVLHPAESVTDDRTGRRTEDAQAVLDGDLADRIPPAGAPRS